MKRNEFMKRIALVGTMAIVRVGDSFGKSYIAKFTHGKQLSDDIERIVKQWAELRPNISEYILNLTKEDKESLFLFKKGVCGGTHILTSRGHIFVSERNLLVSNLRVSKATTCVILPNRYKKFHESRNGISVDLKEEDAIYGYHEDFRKYHNLA